MRRTARDYETDYTRCRLRTRGRSVRFGPFRDLPRQLSSRRSRLPSSSRRRALPSRSDRLESTIAFFRRFAAVPTRWIATIHRSRGFNPLMGKNNYSATSNNTKLVHWPLMGGLLHLVQRGGDWAGPQPAPCRTLLAVPNLTAHP